MNINDAHPSKYVKHADLKGKRIRMTIATVEMESVSQDPHEADKPVLYFKNAKKGMVLNKTNSSVLQDLYGDETDQWIGMPIVIAPAKTQYQGKLVDCLRLEAPAVDERVAAQATQAAEKVAEKYVPKSDTNGDLNDPF